MEDTFEYFPDAYELFSSTGREDWDEDVLSSLLDHAKISFEGKCCIVDVSYLTPEKFLAVQEYAIYLLDQLRNTVSGNHELQKYFGTTSAEVTLKIKYHQMYIWVRNDNGSRCRIQVEDLQQEYDALKRKYLELQEASAMVVFSFRQRLFHIMDGIRRTLVNQKEMSLWDDRDNHNEASQALEAYRILGLECKIIYDDKEWMYPKLCLKVPDFYKDNKQKGKPS